MNGKALLIKCIVLVQLGLASMTSAQGFAGLGTDAEGFALPQRDYMWAFPQDHSAHPDFRIEWWYVTANLTDATGAEFGIQWTLFRNALAPYSEQGWADPQVWLGHAAATSAQNHYAAERLARGGVGIAGVKTAPFEAWIDHWSMSAIEGEGIDQIRLRASDDRFAYELNLNARGPLVFQGDNGYSVKSPLGQASHYYSQPFYDVEGTLFIDGQEHAVTGQAWLDREWSSQPLSEGQDGWDWFSLSFDNGDKMMFFQLRGETGQNFSSGTYIFEDGTTRTIGVDDVTLEPIKYTVVADRSIPTVWRLAYPQADLDIVVSALNPQAWMTTSISYWEGPMKISGSRSGRGYLEMTGYPVTEEMR